MRKKQLLKGVALAGALVILSGCGEENNGEQVTPLPTAVTTATSTPTPEATVSPAKEKQPTAAPTSITEQMPIYGEVPLLFIETENGAGVSEGDAYTGCKVTVTNCDKSYELSEVTAGIRFRGNSTQMYGKKPYRIKFEEKQQLLGLSEGAHKSWVLLAEMNDPTLLRNYFTYCLANQLDGISYASDCKLVEVYLDGAYSGMYLLAEQTQVDNDRVALDESGVTDGSITDTGYLLELEADLSRRSEEGAEGEAWFSVTGYASEADNSMQMLLARSFDETAAYYVIKSDARSKEQVAFIQDYMIRVYDAVYKEQTREAIESLVDLDSAVDMYLVQLIGNDYDNNYSSMFVYKDAGGRLMFGAPWDFDLAYGNFNGFTEAEDSIYMYHLLRRLGEYDWFKELLRERYRELATGKNSVLSSTMAQIQTLAEEYAGAFEREYARWREDLIGMGGFGTWEMPEGGWNFGEWEMPEDGWNFGEWEMPEGGWNFGEWEMPEGGWNFGEWEMPEDGWNFGEWEMPEGGWNGGGMWGDMNRFSYGAVYDTHAEAVDALLMWLDTRLTWIEEYLGIKRE